MYRKHHESYQFNNNKVPNIFSPAIGSFLKKLWTYSKYSFFSRKPAAVDRCEFRIFKSDVINFQTSPMGICLQFQTIPTRSRRQCQNRRKSIMLKQFSICKKNCLAQLPFGKRKPLCRSCRQKISSNYNKRIQTKLHQFHQIHRVGNANQV